jgi:hypothetical protein
MTILIQIATGFVLVAALLLTGARQGNAIRLLMVSQPVAVAGICLALHRPFLAIAGGAIALVAALRHSGDVAADNSRTGVVAAGLVLAVLCQSQGSAGTPLALILLALLPGPAAPRLFGAANGLLLAGALSGHASPAYAAAFLAIPATLFLPAIGMPRLPARAGWADLAIAIAILGATLSLPLDAAGAIFAPLLALDGVLRSWLRRTAQSRTRLFAIARDALAVAAVTVHTPVMALIAIPGVAALHLAGRRPERGLFVGVGAALALFGWSQASAPSGEFALFAGLACMAAAVPDLAPVAVVFLLRHAPAPGLPGIAVALAALAIAATAIVRAPRTKLLQLAPASLAVLSLPAGDEGRFAALVLAVLVLLTRAAARFPDTAALSRMGLSGLPPLGVFPGVVLAIMAIANQRPWLLPAAIAAQIAIAIRVLPAGDLLAWPKAPSPGWLPLAIAVLAGYFAPASLVAWWHIVAAVEP